MNNDFYYTEWDDSIYDEYKDYEDISDDNSHVVNSEVKKTLDNTVSESKRRKKDEILLDNRFRPARPARKRPPTVQLGSEATRCDKSSCLLPDCKCGGQEIPGNLTREKMPQLVVLTFDDSVNDLNQRLYQSIFHPIRRNPNGCPISATFYVSHEWTDYGHVQNMYSDGHEIASHSISHR